MELFEKDSVEDLLLRGYGNVQIGKMTGVSMRLHKTEYLEKLDGINATEYCGKHVGDRFSRITVIGVLDDYSANKISIRDVKSFLGIMWKTEKECELSVVMRIAGYGDNYEECGRLRQEAIQSKIEQTNMSRYGGKTPMSDMSIREKVKATMVETYGVENISQLDSIKEKKKQTTLKNHGVEHSFQSSEIRAKAKETIREKYGVDNVSQSDEIKKKKAETTLSHFGVENSLQSKEVQDKIAESLRRNHGITDENVVKPFQIKEVLDKSKATCLGRYGVENPFELSDVQEQIRQHWRDTYGVDNPSQVLEIQKKRVETMLERFGVENPFANEDVKEKIRRTNLEKYGVEYVSQNPDIKQKVSDAKRENGTFNTSAPEQWLLEMLVSVFGEHDVLTQHNTDLRYPFHCDFYIKSRDMFVELNAFWTHGNGWFNEESIADNIMLSDWIQGCETKDSEFYNNAIQNWTTTDVVKRETARKHRLNYVVFWDNQLDDAKLWFALGCPDGQDWKEEYSWLPKRQISFSRKFPEILSSAKWITAAAKSANGNIFYKNEIAAWNENFSISRGKLQGRLYANRFKYLGKLPDELTDAEILRGLSIARLVKDNYSSFDAGGMLNVFSRYNVKSVYDPCAGWGERLLACGANNIPYVGCDINSDLHIGYDKLIQHYGLQNVSVICDDSSNYDATNNTHDTVFTCPPYGNREIYTEVGAENLSDEEFLLWWDSVVKHSISPTTKYFMYQIDKKHCDDMNRVLQGNGLIFIEEIVASDSTRHENKAKGKRIRENYEAIQVFAIPQK